MPDFEVLKHEDMQIKKFIERERGMKDYI